MSTHDSFVAVGYVLVKPVDRPEYCSAELLPSRILSACNCLCPRFPTPDSIEWVIGTDDQRNRRFDEVGLAPELRSAAHEWATEQFDRFFGWPGVFFRMPDARMARDRFFPDGGGLSLLGLGVARDVLDSFIAAAAPAPPVPGYSAEGEGALVQVAKLREPLAAGHGMLGFELLNVEHGQIGHSWLCNGLEAEFAESQGVRPGPRGLIESLAEAQRCCELIATDEVGAEPGPWFPFLLAEYP